MNLNVLRKLLLTAAVFLLVYAKLNAQGGANLNNFNKMVDILPPAPNASAIMQYGGLNVNKNTGAPSINIPLLSISSKKVSTALAINYSATGIKVDEIASRVGIGWSLQAGGVVTRSVRGTPDETNPRKVPPYPIGTNFSTFNFMDSIASSDDWSGFDSEPDLYNFNINGYSGSFVFDSVMNIIQVNQSNIKIYHDFDSTHSWQWKIVTPDGIVHYFGGPGRIERTKRDQICGKVFNAYLPTAWYIRSIVHPNGDSLAFNYTDLEYTHDTGVSQIMHWSSGLQICPSVTCNSSPMSTCINLARTKGVLLDEIVSTNNSKIKFYYTTRTDCGDRLVSKIELINTANSSVVNRFDFTYSIVSADLDFANETTTGYDKTPYLVKLEEKSGDSSLSKPYFFKYIDPAGRAPRLSFSQDHWGFFNGASNDYFIPPPTNTQNLDRFPFATANREPSFNYAIKGMLCKIIYPTGGLDSIIYAPNILGESQYGVRHQYTCSSTGTGFNTQVITSAFFRIAQQQEVKIYMTCIDNSGIGEFDSLHNKGRVEIVDSATNSVEYSQLMFPGQNFTAFEFLSSGTYKIKIYANGSVVTTEATLTYRYGDSIYSTQESFAGLRVRSVMTAVPDNKPILKEYYYTNLNSNATKLYEKAYKKWYYCPIEGPYTHIPNFEYCESSSMHSNSIVSLYNFLTGPVSYEYVTEGVGEDFANGKTESRFFVGRDARGWKLWGDEIWEAPYNNSSSYLNGKLRAETIYKRNGSGVLVPLKKEETSYKVENVKSQIGYMVNRHVDIPYTMDTTCSLSNSECLSLLITSLKPFSMYKYDVASSWIHPDTVITTLYDQSGSNPVVTTSKQFYENSTYPDLLTKTETYNSKGELLKTENKYPPHFAGTAVYDSMVAKNIVASLIDIKSYNASTLLSEVKTSYKSWGSNNYEPDTVFSAIKGATLENEGTINQRDGLGNILEFTGKDGIVNAVIWGYNYQYPVAKIAGATYSQATAELSVSMTALQSLDGYTLQAEVNRIRTGISSAYITTYTYRPQVGVLTITDPNNKTNRYEYDSFNRLKLIRDQDSMIVKKIDYNYATVDTNATFTIYFNIDTGQYFNPQNCASGYTGVQYYYGVPAGKYYSLVSQSAANAKAQAEISANGQVYANSFSYCVNNTNPAQCTGVNKKVVNCLCETGVKVYTASVEQPNGQWLCTYHYEWSDGSWSENYQEYSATCCYLCPIED